MSAAAPTEIIDVLQAHDVVELNVVNSAEINERLVTMRIQRLGIAFAMSIGDAAMAARALAATVQRAMDLNQEDAEKSGASIVLPASRH